MDQSYNEMWIIKSRPESLEEMLITDEMVELIDNNENENILLYGPIGSGKTVLAEALTKFQGLIISCKEYNDLEKTFNNAENVNSIVIKNIENHYNKVDLIKKAFNGKKLVFVTRDENSAELEVFNSFLKIHTNQFLPKNNKSFRKYERFIEKLLKRNQINYDSTNEQYKLNVLEIYEKLWPKMRQIVRHAQMRSKSKEWVPIPV